MINLVDVPYINPSFTFEIGTYYDELANTIIRVNMM